MQKKLYCIVFVILIVQNIYTQEKKREELAFSDSYKLIYSYELKMYQITDKKGVNIAQFVSDEYFPNNSSDYLLEENIQKNKYLIAFVETKPEKELADGLLVIYIVQKNLLKQVYKEYLVRAYYEDGKIYGEVFTPLCNDDVHHISIPILLTIEGENIRSEVLLNDKGKKVLKEMLEKEPIMSVFAKELISKWGL